MAGMATQQKTQYPAHKNWQRLSFDKRQSFRKRMGGSVIVFYAVARHGTSDADGVNVGIKDELYHTLSSIVCGHLFSYSPVLAPNAALSQRHLNPLWYPLEIE